jgi:hypothetical protein
MSAERAYERERGPVDMIAVQVLGLDLQTGHGEGLPTADLNDFRDLKAGMAIQEDTADMAAREGKSLVGFGYPGNIIVSLKRNLISDADGVLCQVFTADGTRAAFEASWRPSLNAPGGVVEITDVVIARPGGFMSEESGPQQITRSFLKALTPSEPEPLYTERFAGNRRTAGYVGRLLGRNKQ